VAEGAIPRDAKIVDEGSTPHLHPQPVLEILHDDVTIIYSTSSLRSMSSKQESSSKNEESSSINCLLALKEELIYKRMNQR
jgi:hypothetical protein